MENQKIKISIITPTTGKDSLFRLMSSIEEQGVLYEHILLWDDKREGKFLYPDPITLKTLTPFDLENDNTYSIIVKGKMIQGQACGSAIRSVGMMAAQGDFVTFADDDVWYEDNHLSNMLQLVQKAEWGYCRRKIWDAENNCLGIDNFESVGDSKDRKVPYEMVDNNSMIFSRRFGTSGAVLYRETKDYNDDRLFYAFLKKNAGQPGKSELATVNQVCPERLRKMFEQNCTK